MIGFSAVWTAAAGYGLYAVRSSLATAQRDNGARRKQAEDLSREIRRQQALVAQAADLRTETPDDAGAPEWADRLNILARESAVSVDSLRMTTDAHPTAAPNAPGTPGSTPGNASGSGANPPAGNNAANGNAPQKDPDDGWKKVKFDCVTVGTFRALDAFVSRLNGEPYVLEIAEADMTRERYDTNTGALLLRLKLTLSLYGLPKGGEKAK